jgi:hypothetical protein
VAVRAHAAGRTGPWELGETVRQAMRVAFSEATTCMDAIAPVGDGVGGQGVMYVPRRGAGRGGALAFLQTMANQRPSPSQPKVCLNPNHVTRVLVLRTERSQHTQSTTELNDCLGAAVAAAVADGQLPGGRVEVLLLDLFSASNAGSTAQQQKTELVRALPASLAPALTVTSLTRVHQVISSLPSMQRPPPKVAWLRPAGVESAGTTFRVASARVAAAAAPEYVQRLAQQQLGLCQLTVTNIPMTPNKNNAKKEVHSVTLLHPVVRARALRRLHF